MASRGWSAPHVVEHALDPSPQALGEGFGSPDQLGELLFLAQFLAHAMQEPAQRGQGGLEVVRGAMGEAAQLIVQAAELGVLIEDPLAGRLPFG